MNHEWDGEMVYMPDNIMQELMAYADIFEHGEGKRLNEWTDRLVDPNIDSRSELELWNNILICDMALDKYGYEHVFNNQGDSELYRYKLNIAKKREQYIRRRIDKIIYEQEKDLIDERLGFCDIPRLMSIMAGK